MGGSTATIVADPTSLVVPASGPPPEDTDPTAEKTWVTSGSLPMISAAFLLVASVCSMVAPGCMVSVIWVRASSDAGRKPDFNRGMVESESATMTAVTATVVFLRCMAAFTIDI